MRKYLKIRDVLLVFILVAGCSIYRQCFAQEREQAGVAADVATTVIGVTSGAAVELNPLAIPFIPLRLHLIEEANNKPDGERQEALDQINAVNTGVVASNLIVLLFHAVVPVVGVIAGVVAYQQGEKRREFMTACQYRKETFPDEANLTCKS